MSAAEIFDFLYDREITLKANVKDHDDTSTPGFGYDLGALDELRYIIESLEEMEKLQVSA